MTWSSGNTRETILGAGTGVFAKDACGLDDGGGGGGVGVPELRTLSCEPYEIHFKGFRIYWVLGMSKMQSQVDLQKGREDHKFDYGLWLTLL